LKLNKNHGPTFVVKYLKASQLALQKKVAGQALGSLRELEPDLPLPGLSRGGLPLIIGTRHRRALSSTVSTNVLRLWLTLFSIYRVIRIPVKPKLSTITDPFCGSDAYLRAVEAKVVYLIPKLLKDRFNKSQIESGVLLPIEKASPSNSKS
jgi:hypothetical protein